jgi:NTE family protein
MFKKLFLSAALLCLPAHAARAEEPATPNTCLVLSGGGARGMAHVGVLKVLERERIPVDCIVGTSMGAVVGSLYASGYSATEVEALLNALDWDEMFSDVVDRTVYTTRRKEDDRSFLIKAAFGLRGGSLQLPPSLFEGQRLSIALRGALLKSAGIEKFDQLPIQYRAVGANLETGDAVVMDRGDLVNAVRASMAVPGVFPPVSYGDVSLIDGGVAMNLPVQVAQSMGAKHIIAVDISAGLKKRDELTNPLSITDQMITALIQKETRRQIQLLKPNDVLLIPALGNLSSADFKLGLSQGVALGEQATQAALPKLKALSISEPAYAQWRSEKVAKLPKLGPISRINLTNTSRMADAAILAYISEHPGEAFDQNAFEADINKLYGTGEFSRAYYVVEADKDNNTVVNVVTRSRRWEQDGRLKFGLSMYDDFDGESGYQLGARYTQREMNTYGGDWLAEASIGKTNRFFAEWNQPLDIHRNSFARTSLDIQGRNQILRGTDLLQADFRSLSNEFKLGAGLNFDSWGEVSLSPFVRRTRFSYRDNIAKPAGIPDSTVNKGVELAFVMDTLDDSEFPSKGWLIDARHERYLEGLSSDATGFNSRVSMTKAFAFDKDRLVANVRTYYANSSATEDLNYLGGALNLSGLAPEAINGRASAFAGLTYYHPLNQVLSYPLFIGGSIEAGQAWADLDAVSSDTLLFNASTFAALSTPFGPIYFGLGWGEGGENSVFFSIGKSQ